MNDKIRVAICDDAQYLCQGFKTQLSKEERFEIVGMANSAAECTNMVENVCPDVLLLDIRMETDHAGIDAIAGIQDVSPNTKIIMLTCYDDENYVFDAFANGADDYCLKDADISVISEKICSVYDGVPQIDPAILKKLMKKTREMYTSQNSILILYSQISSLTSGEFELLSEMYYGSSYKKIAEKKAVEVDSVRKMAQRLLAKFDARSMKELIFSMKQLRFFETIEKKN